MKRFTQFCGKFVRAGLVSVAVALYSYLGAQRWSPDRSDVPGQVQDARFDANNAVRVELVRKARSFEKNNAIFNRLADLFEQYTVGTSGLQILPDSSDDDWNEIAAEWWQQWCTVCDLTSRLSFGTLQSLAARAWFVDGEVFIHKTRGETPPYRPRIQLIESHRIETPPQLYDLEGKSIIDGIEINSIGRPTAYWMRDGFGVSVYKRIPADSIIHVFEPSRPGQMRGLPFCYPVIPDLMDLDELQILEMRAAKDQAEKSTFLFTESGEQPRTGMSLTQRTNTTQTSNGTEVTEKRIAAVKKAVGGKVTSMKKGEDVKFCTPERPSVATREYWDYLTAKACIGTGISQLLVFPKSLQGTVARGELDIANSFFRARSAVLADAFKLVYVYVMGWAITYNFDLMGAPADGTALRCVTRAPRAVNVDAGRNSSAMLAELESGARTYEDVYAELGKDWRREINQRAREEAYIDKVAKKFNLSPDRIRKAISESLKTEMALADEKQQKEDDQQVLSA